MEAKRLAGYPGASAETYESNFFLLTKVESTYPFKSRQGRPFFLATKFGELRGRDDGLNAVFYPRDVPDCR